MIQWRIIREKALRLGVALLAGVVVRSSFPGGRVGYAPVDEMLGSGAFFVDSPLILPPLAFLIGWVGFGLVLETRGRTVLRMMCGAGLSIAAAWALSPLCGPFPPLVLFLCWLACPETLYFPRRYAADDETEDGSGEEVEAKVPRSHFSLEIIVALGALALLEASMVIGAFRVTGHSNWAGLGWTTLAAPFIGGALYWLITRGRREKPPLLLRTLSIGYHGMEIGFWAAFGLRALLWFA